MPAELTRCTDCGAPLKGVPSWLATADVSFTCSNCPKRPSRAPRIEAVAEIPAILAEDPDLADVEIEEIDDEADLEIPADDLDDAKPE